MMTRLGGLSVDRAADVGPVFFFFTLVTGPRRSLSLKLSDTRVYEPQIRARLGTTAHFCEVVVLTSEACPSTGQPTSTSLHLPRASMSQMQGKLPVCPATARTSSPLSASSSFHEQSLLALAIKHPFGDTATPRTKPWCAAMLNRSPPDIDTSRTRPS